VTETEAYHSPPSNTEVKNAWIYISPPPRSDGFVEYRGLALSPLCTAEIIGKVRQVIRTLRHFVCYGIVIGH
jgi:hypothetical protein